MGSYGGRRGAEVFLRVDEGGDGGDGVRADVCERQLGAYLSACGPDGNASGGVRSDAGVAVACETKAAHPHRES